MHLDAEGTPTLYGTTSAIWRLPFFAFLTTVMALGLDGNFEPGKHLPPNI